MKSKRLPVDSIIASTSLRTGDITELSRSIAEVGLLHPVTVDPEYNLLAGYRRFEACKGLGWETIPVHVVTHDALRNELVTLGENLTQLGLTAMGRAQALSRQAEIYAALYPQTRPVRERGGPGRGKTGAKRMTPVFSEVAAKKLGMGRRTAERIIEIGRRLDPHAASVLHRHPVANSQSDLSQLARLPAADQRKIAKTLADGKARSVKGAIRENKWVDSERKAPTQGKRYTLLTGDFLDTLGKVKAGTADLVCTDPLWGRDFGRYPELGEAIARTLKPRGYAVVMLGQEYLPHLFEGFRGHLIYRWLVCTLRLSRQTQDWNSGHMSAWLPAVVFTKGKVKTQRFESDVIGQNARRLLHGEYEKEVEIPLEIIKRYSQPGDLVVDPFVGLGSTGEAALRLARKFIGADIDPRKVKATASRLASTPWADPAHRPKDRSKGTVTERWVETR